MTTKPEPPSKFKKLKKLKPSGAVFIFGGEYRLKNELRKVEQKEIISKWNNLNEDKKLKYQKMYEKEMKIYQDKLKQYTQTKEYKLYRRSLKKVKFE